MTRQFLKFSFLGVLFAIPNFALADPSPQLRNFIPAVGTLEEFIYLLIDIMQWVALPVLALCIIRAGFLLVTARGDEKQIESGKLWVVWTLVGAAIVLGARVIASIAFGTASLF